MRGSGTLGPSSSLAMNGDIHVTRRIRSSLACILGAALLVSVEAACTSNRSGEDGEEGHEQRVSLADLPAPVKAAAEKLTAGGVIEKIDKENEHGRVVYDVEAKVGGKHVEYTIAADGAVVGTETSIEFKDLPAAVREAAEKYFAGATGLTAALVSEGGKTSYEIEGTRNGKKAAATFDPTGKLLEEE